LRHVKIWRGGSRVSEEFLQPLPMKKASKRALPERQRIARIKMLSGDSGHVHP
jgi:hypothetical protein